MLWLVVQLVLIVPKENQPACDIKHYEIPISLYIAHNFKK